MLQAEPRPVAAILRQLASDGHGRCRRFQSLRAGSAAGFAAGWCDLRRPSSLFVLTVVAIAAGHWPESWNTLAELAQGYALTDKGFGNHKLPLIFLVMLWPLMLNGAGRLALDAWVCRRWRG